jgi:hypothetical protein
MRRLSHIPSFLAFALVLLCCGSVTRANSIPIDPDMGLEGTGSNPCSGFEGAPCTQNNCMIGCIVQLDATGSGIADIFNDSGFNIVRNTINVFNSFDHPLNCRLADPSFGYGTPTGGGDGNSCTWSTIESLTRGIQGGATYGIHFFNFTLNNIPLSSLSFNIVSQPGIVPTPEPPSFVLLGTGLAVLAAGRRVLTGRRVPGLL